jgi:hypothetical protein
MQTKIGDRTSTLFWRDRWLHGQRIEDLAPRQLGVIPKRRANKCTILEALMDHKWINDIQGALVVGVIADNFLQPGIEDSHF